jgi:hypothetical protein
MRTCARVRIANRGNEISRASVSTAPGRTAQNRATAVKLRP